MREAVKAAFFDWSSAWEGKTDWLYADVKNLITIGIGQLADPFPLMAGLRFTRPDGTEATPSEISQAWLKVKGRSDMTNMGGGAYRYLTTIRATPDSLARHAAGKLASFEADLRVTFPDWDAWPACAQLATLGMAWAAGSRCFAKFPHFSAAARVQDWATCARESHLDETGNAGLKPRNVAQRDLFLRAAAGGDPDTL